MAKNKTTNVASGNARVGAQVGRTNIATDNARVGRQSGGRCRYHDGRGSYYVQGEKRCSYCGGRL